MRSGLWLALIASVALATPVTKGQAQDVDRFGCSDDDAQSERPYSSLGSTEEFGFRRLVAGDPAPGGVPILTLGPFDDEIYCFRTAEVFAVDLVSKSRRGYWQLHDIDVKIHLAGPDHDSWWALTGRSDKEITSSLENGSGSALAGVTWALPGAREPVLEVAINAEAVGLGQRSSETRHLLIDLRSGVPHILAEYVCGGADPGGMPCTWGEAIHETGGFSCVWDRSVGDYRCTSQTEYDLPWIHYSRESCFLLDTRRSFQCDDAPTVAPRRLTSALIEAMSGARAMGRSVALADIGLATVVASAPPRPRAAGGVVLATASDGLTFEPSLYFAYVRADGSAALEALDLQFVGAGAHPESRGGPVASSDWHARPTSLHPIHLLSSTLFADQGELRIFQIVIEQAKARALLLVGLDGGGADLRTGAVVLATKAIYLGRCGDPLYPATAVALRSESGHLPLQLDVEPTFQAPGIQGPSQDGCREILELNWKHGSGFVLEKKSETCHWLPNVRQVEIADDGFLSYSTLISR